MNDNDSGDYEFSHTAQEKIIHEDGSQILQRVLFATKGKEIIKIVIPQRFNVINNNETDSTK